MISARDDRYDHISDNGTVGSVNGPDWKYLAGIPSEVDVPSLPIGQFDGLERLTRALNSLAQLACNSRAMKS